MHQKLINFLKENHKITMADFIKFALHSADAYYIKKNPFKNSKTGNEGDFITAPELSQIFGEFIAIWIIHNWELLKKPPKINLIELGPGKGTLLKDILPKYDINYNFLNFDIQGAELKALKGMEEYLNKVDYIYTEVNCDYVYKNCALITEIDEYLSQFRLYRVETEWCQDFKWGDAFYIRK